MHVHSSFPHLLSHFALILSVPLTAPQNVLSSYPVSHTFLFTEEIQENKTVLALRRMKYTNYLGPANEKAFASDGRGQGGRLGISCRGQHCGMWPHPGPFAFGLGKLRHLQAEMEGKWKFLF